MSPTVLVPVYFGAIEAGRLWRFAKRDRGVIFTDSFVQDSHPFPKAWFLFLPHRRGVWCKPRQHRYTGPSPIPSFSVRGARSRLANILRTWSAEDVFAPRAHHLI
jgi:hypothetical protein